MLETPGRQVQKLPRRLMLMAAWGALKAASPFLGDTVFMLQAWFVQLSSTLTFIQEHVHCGSFRACRNWGWKWGSESRDAESCACRKVSPAARLQLPGPTATAQSPCHLMAAISSPCIQGMRGEFCCISAGVRTPVCCDTELRPRELISTVHLMLRLSLVL